MTEDIMTKLFNAFQPAKPLEPGDPVYVDCRAVRGDENILTELGNNIIRSELPTCQIYTGHRGAGKTTELKRLKAHLEKNGCFVVYFAATDFDVDENNTEYTDILLACTRHALEQLKDFARPNLLIDWLRNRWESLKELALTEIDFDDVKVEASIGIFAKLTANLRGAPATRSIIRKEVEVYMEPLTKALNEFLHDAKQNLPKDQSRLVIIVDNLDRLTMIRDEEGRTNYDLIFLDRSEQLKALNCHVIYTIPISLVYSTRAPDLRNTYGTPEILPMIKIQTREGKDYQEGLGKLQEIIQKRVATVDPTLALGIDTSFFENEETRLRLFRMTGGHIREMMILMQTAINQVENLPMTAKAVQRAITKAGNDTYLVAVDEDDWEKLARVYVSKKIVNQENYRELLFRRCLLEYREETPEGELIRWYDVHPLIKNLPKFKETLKKMEPTEERV